MYNNCTNDSSHCGRCSKVTGVGQDQGHNHADTKEILQKIRLVCKMAHRTLKRESVHLLKLDTCSTTFSHSAKGKR